MKRIILIIGVILISTINNLSAQELKIGVGAVLGTETSINNNLSGKSAFGLNARGNYKFNERWGLTGGFTYFFSQAPDPIKSTVYQFNLDGTFSFVNNDNIDFYGLLGFDVGYAKMKNKTYGFSVDDSKVGLELGVGLITKFGIFFEAKAEGAFEQGQFTLGYLFKL